MALVADLLQQTFVILLIGRVLGTKDVSCPEFLQGLPVLTGSFIREAKLVMGMCIVRAQARGLAEFRDRPSQSPLWPSARPRLKCALPFFGFRHKASQYSKIAPSQSPFDDSAAPSAP